MTTNGDGSGDLVQIRDLQMHFPVTKGIILQRQVGAIKAVDGVSFNIKKGETLGLVGESGCGKSTTGRAILQLYRPTGGSVIFQGTDLTKLKGEEMRRMRRKVQMIFQDPYASLNPRMTVGDIIGEPIKVHGLRHGKEVRVRVQELLHRVARDHVTEVILAMKIHRAGDRQHLQRLHQRQDKLGGYALVYEEGGTRLKHLGANTQRRTAEYDWDEVWMLK